MQGRTCHSADQFLVMMDRDFLCMEEDSTDLKNSDDNIILWQR